MAEKKPKIKPGKVHFIWALIVLLITQGLAIYWGFTGFSRFINDLIEVDGPGSETVALEEPGIYTIFYEDTGEEQEDGTLYFLDPPPIITTLTSVETEQEVPLTKLEGNFTYVSGTRGGIELYDVEITEPGNYIMATRMPSQFNGLRLDFRIAHDLDGHFVRTTIGALVTAAIGWVGAIVIIIFVAVKRRNAKNSSKS